MVKMPVPTSLPRTTSPNGRPGPSGRCAATGPDPASAAANSRLAERASFTRGSERRGGAPGEEVGSTVQAQVGGRRRRGRKPVSVLGFGWDVLSKSQRRGKKRGGGAGSAPSRVCGFRCLVRLLRGSRGGGGHSDDTL